MSTYQLCQHMSYVLSPSLTASFDAAVARPSSDAASLASPCYYILVITYQLLHINYCPPLLGCRKTVNTLVISAAPPRMPQAQLRPVRRHARGSVDRACAEAITERVRRRVQGCVHGRVHRYISYISYDVSVITYQSLGCMLLATLIDLAIQVYACLKACMDVNTDMEKTRVWSDASLCIQT